MKKQFNDIEYEYIDPTGNITALVRTAVDVSKQPEIAGMIMDRDASIEQVGYVGSTTNADIRLRMAAGEFCGNATMSVAALFCDDCCIPVGSDRIVSVESSGCSDIVMVNITRKEDANGLHIYDGSVEMPLPAKITQHKMIYKDRGYDLCVVGFDGISHIIALHDDFALSDDDIDAAIRLWCNELNVPCLGIIIIDENETVTDNNGTCIDADICPVVYVPSLGTCYHESSCASGTTAAAAYYRHKGITGKLTVRAHEKGGTLTVNITDDGHLFLNGKVRL